MGQKPDDWNVVALCGGVEGCHSKQHRVGERTFWEGRDVSAIIDAFINSSPARVQILQAKRDRSDGKA